jgi:tetratricopeptide (TPR) repeat protein
MLFNRLLIATAMLLSWRLVPATSVTWRSSIEEAMRISSTSHKPVLVYFYARWENWCKRCDKEVFEDTVIVKRLRSFELARVDVDTPAGAKKRKRYEIYAYPSFLFIDAKGSVLTKSTGFEERPNFLQRLGLALSLAEKQRNIEALAKKSSNPLLWELKAILFAKQWMESDALQSLKKAKELDPQNKLGHLATAFNSLGDYYQQRQQFRTAIHYFIEGSRVARTPDEEAYSCLSVNACARSTKNWILAAEYARATLAIPGVSRDDRRMASDFLARLMPTGRAR